MLCRLQCARFAKRVAHCRRTFRQPSALIRSPPTFKRRQAACESLAGRLHSELDNIMSGDVTLGVFVKLSNVHLFGASPSTMKPLRRRNHAPLTRVAIRAVHRRAPHCGGRLVCRAVAPLRVVKNAEMFVHSAFCISALAITERAMPSSIRRHGLQVRHFGVAIRG